MADREGLSVQQLQRDGTMVLKKAGVEGPGRDARILLAHLLNIEPGCVLTVSAQSVSRAEAEIYMSLIRQRAGGKPVHRIVGAREFYGRMFLLNEACLEPRPETELLVERVLADQNDKAELRFAEVGVGSGVISVSLLCELALAKAVGTDISNEALKAAENNAVAHRVMDRLALREADCLYRIEGPFDFVVSNPPYIASRDIAGLSKEVRDHDPVVALDGGIDGLDIYERLLKTIGDKLKSCGRLYLETGHGQHADICALAVKNGWGVVSCHLDLSGLERIVVLESGNKQETHLQGRSDTVKARKRKDLELPQ